MKKFIFLISIFITTSFAQATNDQILKKLNKIENDVQLMKQEMNLRFESMDKRFEMMNESFNKRFESMDKRFEMMNENFNKRFEAMDKRFEMMQHYMDKRFETLTNFIITLTAGIFGLIGFMMWDRRTVAQKVKEECNQEIETKADKEYVDRFVKAMNELLVLKDETAINVFRKYNLL